MTTGRNFITLGERMRELEKKGKIKKKREEKKI